MTNNIALVSQSKSVALSDLMAAGAAVQKQVIRDFSPLWEITASINTFGALEDVPVGYWPVIIVDAIATGDLGIHGQRDKQPIAFVQTNDNWTLTLSHEVLEMLADPYSSRLVAGDSMKGDNTRVEYLVEICDPCQDAAFGYQINGILVSDFYTPAYFNASGTANAQYDYLGKMSQPRSILEGGYLSWREPMSNHLFRADMIDSQLYVSDLGEVPTNVVSLRSHVDRNPPALSKRRIKRSALKHVGNVAAVGRINHKDASRAKAERLRKHFESLGPVRSLQQ